MGNQLNFGTSFNGYISGGASVDLFSGFEPFAEKARSQLGRELVKVERNKLLREYTGACNRQGLFTLPDQTKLPFSLCVGDVYEQTQGSVNRFKRLVIAHLLRQPTLKEWNYIKPQYNKATSNTRKAPNPGGMSYNEGLAKLKEQILVAPTKIKQNSKGAGLFLDPLVKNKVIPKDYARAYGFAVHNTFNYHTAKENLRADLKAGKLTHPAYNNRLKELKNFKNDLIKEIEKGFAAQLRNAHNNSSRVHIGQNIKGSVNTGIKGGRYTQDDYAHDTGDQSHKVNPGSYKAMQAEKVKLSTHKAEPVEQRLLDMIKDSSLDQFVVRKLIAREYRVGPTIPATHEEASTLTLEGLQQRHEDHGRLLH